MRYRRILPILALSLMSMDARSLGIGEIVSQPRLGERLRIEVRLLADDGPVDPACIRLAPGDNSDDLPWVRGARLRVQGGPRPSLIIESNEPVNHPIYMLGLRVGCGSEVRREFTLMPQAPVELPVAANPVAAQAKTATASVAEPRDASAVPATAPVGGWQISQGETLSSIAASLFPNDRASQKTFVRESVRANPRLFAGISDPAGHPLPAGEYLVLPGTTPRAPLVAAPPRPPKPAVRRPAREPRTEAESAAPRHAAKRTPEPSRSEDRLMVASGTDNGPGLKITTKLNDARSRGLSEEQRERLRQEQRLIAELDEKIIASLAMAEKIRNMEGYLEKLQGDMQRLDQKIRLAGDNTSVPAGASAGTASGALPGGAASATSAPATASGTATASAESATPPAPVAQPTTATAEPTPAIAPKPAQKKPVAKPAVVADDTDWWTYGAAGAGVLALFGLLLARRRKPAAVEEAEFVEQPVAAQTELPPSAPAPEQTLAQQVPTTRVDLAPALEMELEPPAEPDTRIGVAEHDSALELAEIMLSFGRVQGAAQTLTDYIHTNPRQAVRPWLKLLEIYHGAGMRSEFDALMDEFHLNFNVEKVTWDDYAREVNRASIEDMPHLMHDVTASWPSRKCLDLLHSHLRDNREGTRSGFPISIADDMATLIGLLESRYSAAAQGTA